MNDEYSWSIITSSALLFNGVTVPFYWMNMTIYFQTVLKFIAILTNILLNFSTERKKLFNKFLLTFISFLIRQHLFSKLIIEKIYIYIYWLKLFITNIIKHSINIKLNVN